jgi:hypothetical protein
MRLQNRAGRSRFFTLLGLTVVTVAFVAATRRQLPAALTIAPSSHDFDSVVVQTGVGQTFDFNVTRSPGGGPTDSLVASVTGPNAGDFRVPGRSNRCGGPSLQRAPSCNLGVDFVPTALGVRNATLVVSDTRGNSGTAALTGTGIFGCRVNVVHCNYGDHYSGNLQWTEALTFSSTTGTSSRSSQRIIGVTINVTKGGAFCDGTYTDTSATYESGKMIGFSKARGPIQGPGLLTVEFEKDGGNLVYEVAVACPSAQYTESTTDLISGQTVHRQVQGTPAEMDGREYRSYKLPASAVGIDLSGRVHDTHPDADPVNGGAGTITLVWTLNRVIHVP